MTVAKQQLQYQFHNPNTVEDTADFLLHLFVEVNRPKVDRAVQSGIQSPLHSRNRPADCRGVSDIEPPTKLRRSR